MKLTIQNDSFTSRPINIGSFPWFDGELDSAHKKIKLNSQLGSFDISYNKSVECEFTPSELMMSIFEKFHGVINKDEFERTVLLGVTGMFLRKVTYHKANVTIDDSEIPSNILNESMEFMIDARRVNPLRAAFTLFTIEDTVSEYCKTIYTEATHELINSPLLGFIEGFKMGYKVINKVYTIKSTPIVWSDTFSIGFLIATKETFTEKDYQEYYPKLYQASFTPLFMFLMDKDEKLFNCFVGRFGLIKAWVSIMTPERIEQYFKKKPEDKNLRFESAILWNFPEMANKNVSTESMVSLCIAKPDIVPDLYNKGLINEECLNILTTAAPDIVAKIKTNKDDLAILLEHIKSNRKLPSGINKIDELPESIQTAVCLYMGNNDNCSYLLIAKTASEYRAYPYIKHWFRRIFDMNGISSWLPEELSKNPEVIEQMFSMRYSNDVAKMLIAALWENVPYDLFKSFCLANGLPKLYHIGRGVRNITLYYNTSNINRLKECNFVEKIKLLSSLGYYVNFNNHISTEIALLLEKELRLHGNGFHDCYYISGFTRERVTSRRYELLNRLYSASTVLSPP